MTAFAAAAADDDCWRQRHCSIHPPWLCHRYLTARQQAVCCDSAPVVVVAAVVVSAWSFAAESVVVFVAASDSACN